MAEVSKATLVLTGDTGRLRRALGSAKRQMRTVGSRVQRNARRMGQAVAAAAGAAGAAMVAFATKAVRASARFEASITEIETLVGLSREQVAGMSQDIKRLAIETGRPLQGLSEAMFAITSGGLRGSEAMNTLRQTAKASAIGLGNMEAIGRAATGALQAFGDAGLTATEAIDTMVATVRTGNLNAESLAGTLGRVTGLASSLGVSFQDVNAFLATFTRLGVNTEEAATALRGTFNALLKTSGKQEKAFAKLETSAEDVLAQMGEEGLAQTLIDLVERSERMNVNISEVIPNVRALSGVLGTATSQSEEYVKVQEEVRNAVGITNEGFNRTRETLQNLINRTKQTWEVFKVNFGDRIAPIASELLEAFQRNMPQIGSVIASAMAHAIGAVQAVLNFFRGATKEIGTGGLIGFLFMGPQGAAIGGLIGKVIAENSIRLKQTADMLGRDVEFSPLERAIIERREIERQMRNTLGRIQEMSRAAEGAPSIGENLLGTTMGPAGFDHEDKIGQLVDRYQELERMLSDTRDRAKDLMEQGFELPAQAAGESWQRLNELLDEAQRRLRELANTSVGVGAGDGDGSGTGQPSAPQIEDPLGATTMGFGGGGIQRPGLGDALTERARLMSIAVRDFTQRLRDAHRELMQMEGGLGEASDTSDEATSVLRGLGNVMAQVAGFADNLAAKLLRLANSILNAIDQIGSAEGTGGILSGIATGLGGFLPFFQHGGRLGAGQLGIAGEAGPEVIRGPAEIQPIEGGAAGGVIDASNLTPMGQLAARLAMEDPTLQRLFTAGVESARTRGAF